MKFEVKKIDGTISFEAEIECSENESYGIKLGLAIHWGYKNNKSLENGDYSGANFKNLTFDDSTFEGSRFDDSTFDRSRFDGSTFDDSTFDRSRFEGSRFVRSTFDRSRFEGSRFVRSTFDDSTFDRSTFVRSTFDDSTFDRSTFGRSRFVDSTFVDSTFVRSTFGRSRFVDSTFDDSTFGRSRFVDSTFDDSTFVRSRLDGSTFVRSTFDGKTLRNFKHDLWAILIRYKNEVPALVNYIKEGKIDGSCYSGECSCLMGTFAKIKNLHIEDDQFSIKSSSSPAESWFMMIKPGHTPENNFASKMALEWIEEFLMFADQKNA